MVTRTAAAFLVVASVVTVFARSVDPNAFNYDVAWILYAAEQMLDGQVLYKDVIGQSPPMVFWLSAISAMIARAAGAPPILAFNGLVLLLAGLACALSHRILRLGWPEARSSYRLALISCFGVVAVLYPGFDYGQPENLFFIFATPYIFAAALAARGERSTGTARSLGWTAYAVGALAGIGIAQKPYCALVWLAVEVWLQLRNPAGRAWSRRENRALVGVQLLYAAAVLAFAGDYLGVVEMSMAVASAYADFGSPLLLAHAATAQLILAGALCWLVRGSPVDRELRGVWLVAAVALLAVALAQGKGWPHHYYPASAAALGVAALVGLGLVERQDALADVLRPRAAALPLIGMLLLAAYAAVSTGRASFAAWGPGSPRRSVVTELTRVVKENAWRRPIYVMSTSVAPSFPLVNLTEARWSSRFCCLWLLPGLYSDEERATRPFPYHSRQEMSELERYLLDSVIDDLEAAPPALLIVDYSLEKEGFRGSGFEYLKYFRRDPRFAAMLREYRELTAVGPFRIYRKRGGDG